MRALKNLEDIIQIIYTDFDLTENGWLFTGRNGSSDRDPLYGFAGLKQLYLKADPEYTGRFTVPALWDKKTETVVNNESSEIIRMLYTEFDDLIDSQYRESTKGTAGLYPPHLRSEIDDMNEWVYNTVNNGVYKCGFASNQEAYEASLFPLFASLDRLEQHLANPTACHGGPFLFGQHLTEADIRLYTTIARFDAAYHTIFLCNLKSIRTDYPRLYRWLRRTYWNASNLPKGKVFKDTTVPDIYREGYTRAKQRQTHGPDKSSFVTPRGPTVVFEPWTEDDDDIDNGRIVAWRQSGDKTPAPALSNLSINSGANAIGIPPDAAATSSGKIDLTSSLRSPTNTVTASQTYGSFVTGGDPAEADGEIDAGRKLRKKATYQEENEKWYKAARKAEKKSGAPYVHLAL